MFLQGEFTRRSALLRAFYPNFPSFRYFVYYIDSRYEEHRTSRGSESKVLKCGRCGARTPSASDSSIVDYPRERTVRVLVDVSLPKVKLLKLRILNQRND